MVNEDGTETVLSASDSSNSSDVSGLVPLDPLYVFNEYMRSSAGNLWFQNSETTTQKNTTAKNKKGDKNGIMSNGSAIVAGAEERDAADAAGKKSLYLAVLQEGAMALENLLTKNLTKGESRVKANQVFELNLKTVSLLNFGPYGGERVHYPLEKR